MSNTIRFIPLVSLMTEITQKRPVVSFRRMILRWFLQILIGGTIFVGGLGKSLDLPGFIEVLRTYQAVNPSLLWPLALIVTGIELCLGVSILYGYRLPLSALVGGIMNTSYAVWIVITLFRGLTLSNCGCFGVFFPQPVTWLTPIESLVLAALSVFLAYLAQTEEYPHRRIRTALFN